MTTLAIQPDLEISVVVPAHNEEDYLSRCLKALVEQNYPPEKYEIILVDSESTDNTARIANKFNVNVVKAPKGVSIARQYGFDVAKKEIIASTDADTIVSVNWLRVISQSFSEDRRIVAVHGPVGFLSNEVSTIERLLSLYLWEYFCKSSALFGRKIFAGMNFAVRKDVFIKIGGFDLAAKSAEDVVLARKLQFEGKIVYQRKMLVNTSARRLRAMGNIAFTHHHLRNYFRVCWLGKPPLPLIPFNEIT